MDIKKIVYYETNLTETEYNCMAQLASDKVATGTATQEELNMANFMHVNL